MNSPSLNAMFINKSNDAFNNNLFTCSKIEGMHESMTRLYEIAFKTKGLVTQTDLANALNTSPQRINNWEERGVSKDGLLAAEKLFGCSPSFIETGQQPPRMYAADHQINCQTATYRDQHIADLISTAERLTPEDAKILMPIVRRIADAKALKRPAQLNSNNQSIFDQAAEDTNTGTK